MPERVRDRHVRPRKGDVRPGIVALLSKQPHSVTELAKLLRVSKATISYHVGILKKRNIAQLSSQEPERRGFVRKLYTATDTPSSPIEEKCDAFVTSTLEKLLKDLERSPPEEVGKRIQGTILSLFHVLQYVNKEKHARIVRAFGNRLARHYVTHKIHANTFMKAVSQLKMFYEKHDMGTVVVTELTRIRSRLRVYDCIECPNIPLIGAVQCSFDEGLMEGVLESKLCQRWSVDETRCKADGSQYCEFRIERT
ncbi:MAG: V4R domain-containing protein [Candidatus Bathyarchaeia archaeon]